MKTGSIMAVCSLALSLMTVAPARAAAPAPLTPAAGPTLGAARDGTGDEKLRVVQHNTDMGGYQSALAAATAWGDVDAVTFQELCLSESKALEAAGWSVHWREQRQKNARCAPYGTGTNRTAKGNAIVTTRGMGATTVTKLGTYGGRKFKLLCAEITGSGIKDSWVCTTHLALDYEGAPNGKANRARQVKTIAKKLNPWISQGRRVVLTGDFNDKPASARLAPLYRVAAKGRTDSDKFWEGDQTHECGAVRLCRDMAPTTDKGARIDYFFASWRGVDPTKGMSKGVVASATAGHHIVRGQVKFGNLG